MKKIISINAGIAALAFVLGAVFMSGQNSAAEEAAKTRVFEMRTYYAAPGKMAELEKRFRDHTVKLFEKHGMTNIGYWKPMDGEIGDGILFYVLAHDSREAAAASWKAFIADPEWQKVYKETQANGSLTAKVESRFYTPADYSALK